jgi:hypothetical protein
VYQHAPGQRAIAPELAAHTIVASLLFNLDEASEIPGIVPAALALAKDPVAAKAKAMRAKAFVTHRQRDTLQTLAKSL